MNARGICSSGICFWYIRCGGDLANICVTSGEQSGNVYL